MSVVLIDNAPLGRKPLGGYHGDPGCDESLRDMAVFMTETGRVLIGKPV